MQGRLERQGAVGFFGGEDGSRDSLPLRPIFVRSACFAALRMIRFSDGKVGFVFIFLDHIPSILFAGRILLILEGQVRPGGFRALFAVRLLVFLASMVLPLFHGLRTIALRLWPPLETPAHRRLYRCHDVLGLPVEEYSTRIRAQRHEAVVGEITHTPYAAMAIERTTFDRIDGSPRWTRASFIPWVALIVMTIPA